MSHSFDMILLFPPLFRQSNSRTLLHEEYRGPSGHLLVVSRMDNSPHGSNQRMT